MSTDKADEMPQEIIKEMATPTHMDLISAEEPVQEKEDSTPQ